MKPPELIYHSALQKGKTNSGEYDSVQLVSCRGNVAFAHDMLSPGFPSEFDRCDVFYTDPPWRQGMKIFDKEAGVTDSRSYSEFLLAIARFIVLHRQERPAVIVTGKHALKYLPAPDYRHPITLNGDPALALIYGDLKPNPAWKTSKDILNQLSMTFNCVGDFCCGFGLTGAYFFARGKRFVMSDYNPRCIGYIRDHVMEITNRGELKCHQ